MNEQDVVLNVLHKIHDELGALTSPDVVKLKTTIIELLPYVVDAAEVTTLAYAPDEKRRARRLAKRATAMVAGGEQ